MSDDKFPWRLLLGSLAASVGLLLAIPWVTLSFRLLDRYWKWVLSLL